MHRSFLFLGAALLCTGCGHMRDVTPRTDLAPLPRVAPLARLAPDFTFHGAQVRSLRGLRGQAVVLIIADSPKTGAFKKQLRNLESTYSEFASRQVVFIAAFTQQEGDASVQSNIPFAIANNGPAVAGAYGATGHMTIAIIGRDGNVDYETSKTVPGERVRDVIQNSYIVQAGGRKEVR